VSGVSDDPAITVGFGRLEQRGLLLGLSPAQVGLLGIAVGVVVVAGYTAGAAGVFAALPLWAPPVTIALLPMHGRPVVEWLPITGSWLLRQTGGAARQRTPTTDADPQELVVPGLAALSVVRGPGTGAALVMDRRDGTVTAVLRVHGAGFVLADPGTQAHQVTGWAQVLAALCQQPAIVRVQVVDRTVAGGSAPMRRWWTAHAQTGSTWPGRIVADLVADAEARSVRHETLLAIAVRARRSNPRTTGEELADVEQHLAAVEHGIVTAGLRPVEWAGRESLVGLLRVSFDPASVAARDALGSAAVPGVAGMALDEQWDHLRTDSAVHAVYWVREWPRSEVHAGFLQPVLFIGGARRTLSITVEPLPVIRALRDIRRAKVEHAADAAQRARMGRIEDEATRAEAADLLRREQQLVAGAGDLRFVGLLTVTASSREELPAACTEMETAAAQAMCELRRLVGQQAAGFTTGALPLARGVS
jgi:hypothetical protein